MAPGVQVEQQGEREPPPLVESCQAPLRQEVGAQEMALEVARGENEICKLEERRVRC